MLPFVASWGTQIHPQLKSPKGSCTPKMFLIVGRIKDRICVFKLVRGGAFWKFVIMLFQELIASGKNYSCICLTPYFIKGIRIIKSI